MTASLEIKDCAMIILTVNTPPVFDLRDMRERLSVCPSESLYHHFCQTLLRPTFDDPEYPNDLAFWARHNLHDKTLAERLGVIDPYTCRDLEDLRTHVLDVVEDRIAELPHISSVQTGEEFRFLQALTVTFGTGDQLEEPADLSATLQHMTPSSVWYHFLEARRRNPERRDDFTHWLLQQAEPDHALVQAFSQVDFTFLSLKALQQQLVSLATFYETGGQGK